DAATHWTPVISPSGMAFYTAEAFPQWQNSALIGGLTARGIVRVEVDGQQAREVERIELGARIRDVEQGPDGLVYVLTDQNNGNIWQLSPQQ
ncbi:MAG: PQQ-dependent sugar dehydrogenase, partial [Candidatus Competibacteraceae bacterium]|nr:PQQ-dependent sugar dehydrogenase [Candidatus Competibacteraceae bacterium]